MYTEDCVTQVQPKIPLTKPSSQKLTDTPLRSQAGMVTQSMKQDFTISVASYQLKLFIRKTKGHWCNYSITLGKGGLLVVVLFSSDGKCIKPI